MTDFDPRYLFWAAYGVGLLVVYGLLLRRRLRHLRKHNDPRAFRDAMEGAGLFLVAVGLAFALSVALFSDDQGMVGISLAIVGAAFLVVGLSDLAENVPANGTPGARRQ